MILLQNDRFPLNIITIEVFDNELKTCPYHDHSLDDVEEEEEEEPPITGDYYYFQNKKNQLTHISISIMLTDGTIPSLF